MRSLLVLQHILTCHQKADVDISSACIPVSACRRGALVFTFFEFCFQIWSTPQNYLIGRLSVARATVRKIRLNDSMGNVYMYLPTKYEHKGTYSYWVRSTLVFSQSDALYGYHDNQMKIMHLFWKSVTRATMWYMIHTCNILGKLCNLIRKMWSEAVKHPP